MEVKKLSKIGLSLVLGATLLFQPLAGTASAAGSYKLNNSVKAYISSDYARLGKNARKNYEAGKYYIYKKHNGMINITRVAGHPGAWINPADNKVKAGEKAVVKVKRPVEVKKSVGTVNPLDNKFSVKVKTFGYVNAKDAKAGVNNKTIVFPRDYYIYKTYNGMINVTKVKGVPGSWINPNTTKVVKPSIPVTSSKPKTVTKTTTTVVKKPTIAKTSYRSPKLYTLSQFKWNGVIRWNGYKFTYYSQSVLPGYGLRIPGRHVNSDGYVADKDGYIVLANSAPKGTVFKTPFGYLGKVYDRGVYGNWLDVYIK